MTAKRQREFVCEPLLPVRGSGDAAMAARGEPGLPHQFTWRRRRYRLVRLIEAWKTSSRCRSGADEMYLRRHWYRVLVDPPAELVVYCDRQAKDRRHPKARWWVFAARAVE